MPDVDVDGTVLVAVEKELVAVLLENLRHASTLPILPWKRDVICRTLKVSDAGERARGIGRHARPARAPRHSLDRLDTPSQALLVI